MDVLRSYSELGEWARRHCNAMAFTVGFFDGLHRGHQYLIGQLCDEAHQRSAKSLIVTFSNAPRGYHFPESDWLHLTTPTEKLYLLGQARADATLMLDYDASIAAQSAALFIKGLAHHCPVAALVIGYDSRLGNDQVVGREAYMQLCQVLGIGLRFVEKLEDAGPPIKSRTARDMVASGSMHEANEILGHPYFIMHKVVHGKGLGGSRMNIPTANMLLPREKLTPPTGVYACLAEVDGEQYPSATCVMSARQAHRTVLERERRAEELPTDLNRVVVESHLLGFSGDLYGKHLILRFIRHLRGWVDFDSVHQLRQQIHADADATRAAVRAELG